MILHVRPLLYYGLVLAKSLNIKKFYMKIDAKTVVTIFASHYNLFDSFHRCSVLISDCKPLLHFFKKSHIHHIFCKGNQCTHCMDFLAKERSTIRIALSCIQTPLPLFCSNYFGMLGVFPT